MQAVVPFACFLSVLRPPGVQFENSLLQIAPVDKSKCPFVKDNNDITFQLYTRHNPTVYQELVMGDDERLFASNMDFNDPTVIYFHAFMEQPEEGSGIMVREAYMQRGDTNVIMVDAHYLEAGPWYFTASHNTWYIGNFAAQFVDYMVSRGLNLNNTHFIGHSLGAQSAGVAGSALKSGRVARITGLDAALPLFEGLPLEQRLDADDAEFVDTIHTDGGIFGFKDRIGHVDFFPNGGISPQPGCELEIVIPQRMLLNKFFCSHWRSYRFYAESVLRPDSFVSTQCPSWKRFISGGCAGGRRTHMGYAVDPTELDNTSLEALFLPLTGDGRTHINGFYTFYLISKNNQYEQKRFGNKLQTLFQFIQTFTYSNKGINEDGNQIKIPKRTLDINKITLNTEKPHIIMKSHDQQTLNTNDHLKYQPFPTDRIDRSEIFRILMNDNIGPIEGNDQDILKLNDTLTLFEDIVPTNADAEKLTVVHDADKKTQENIDDVIVPIRHFDQSNTYNTHKTNDELKENNKITPVHNKKDNVNVDPNNKEDQMTISKSNTLLHDGKQNETSDVNHNSLRAQKVTQTNDQERENIKPTDIPIHYQQVKEQTHVDRSPPIEQIKPKYHYNGNQLTKPKAHVVKRQKRFLPFLRSDNEDNILLRMLHFLIKNRKNVLPVFTVMREINTLVRSGSGELSHFSKERNNYIGASAPILPPISYDLELGNESKAVGFVKRLLGLGPKGGRLTVTGSGARGTYYLITHRQSPYSIE